MALGTLELKTRVRRKPGKRSPFGQTAGDPEQAVRYA